MLYICKTNGTVKLLKYFTKHIILLTYTNIDSSQKNASEKTETVYLTSLFDWLVLLSRITPYADEISGDCQCEF